MKRREPFLRLMDAVKRGRIAYRPGDVPPRVVKAPVLEQARAAWREGEGPHGLYIRRVLAAVERALPKIEAWRLLTRGPVEEADALIARLGIEGPDGARFRRIPLPLGPRSVHGEEPSARARRRRRSR